MFNFHDKMKVLISHYNGITHDEAGNIPWFQKDSPDVQFFKQQTMSGTQNVIMGHKTFNSMPKLRNRTNIVLCKKSVQQNVFGHEADFTISSPKFFESACLIGGINTILSYMTSKILNKYNSIFFLTEYSFIEKLPATEHKDLFSFLKPVCNIFSDKFEHKTLGYCSFDVNMYVPLDLY